MAVRRLDACPTRSKEARMRTLSILIAALLTLVPAAAGAQGAPKASVVNVTGVWASTVESPQGSISSTATYKQDGEALTGTHVGQYGELPLKGTVKGNAITYSVTVDMGGQQLTVTYSGKVDGDTITGTADFGGMASGGWSAKRKK
jgi:hypothetical protein